ncbi:MAG: YfhO family protein, partial [Caldilineaceae bacterium]|nr:YfhO family protein [Caldilineaceae bacterium]
LNVKYVLVREGTPLPQGKFERVLGPVNGIEVYENSAFVPRAWLARAGVDLTALDAPATVTAATVRAYSATHMAFDVQAPEAGYLVVSELWYPGWTATVNGATAAIEPVNGALRAVAVPAGASTVEMTYRPRSFTWGLWAALVGLAILIAATFFAQRNNRRT